MHNLTIIFDRATTAKPVNSDKDSYRKLAIALAAVTQAIVYSISGVAAGYYLDAWIKSTAPWLTVIFSLVGLVGGFYRLYQIYMRQNDDSE